MPRFILALLILCLAFAPAVAAEGDLEYAYAASTDEAAIAAVPAPATAEVKVGPLVFESLALAWERPDKTEEVSSTVDVGFLHPVAGFDPKALPALRKGFLDAAFEAAQLRAPDAPDPARPGRDLARLLVARRTIGEGESAEAKASGCDGPNQFGFSLTCEAFLAKGRFLTLFVHAYFYSAGAAHGSPLTLTRVFDLATGAVVPREALILTDDAAKAKVFPLIEKAIHASRGLAPKAKLEEEGFFPENYTLAANVFLKDEGVGFYYNVYEIACYAAGPDEVVIPYAEYPVDALPAKSPIRDLRTTGK